MSGGSEEVVMGYHDNPNGINSDPLLTIMQNIDRKYYNLYSSTQFTANYGTNMSFCTLEICGGHALNETLRWYSSASSFVDDHDYWFARGGLVSYYGLYANEFRANIVGGYSGFGGTWRSVLTTEIN